MPMVSAPVTRYGRACRRCCWLALLVLLCAGGSRAVAQIAAPESEVEAVFLFNFTQFVDWPPGAFTDATQPLVIGVLGEDPFGAYLDEIVRGEKVNNRILVVRRFRREEDIVACHILFISQSESKGLDQILARLRDRSVLTVSNIDDFGRRGGMVRFVVEHNRVRLRINAETAKAAGLTLSSKLLRIAEPGNADQGNSR
jgi:hypothetical protein